VNHGRYLLFAMAGRVGATTRAFYAVRRGGPATFTTSHTPPRDIPSFNLGRDSSPVARPPRYARGERLVASHDLNVRWEGRRIERDSGDAEFGV
jgi:hypothetical protein